MSLSPGQARDLVGRDTLVTAYSRADGSAYTTGRVIGYSVVPEVIIEARDGSRTHWRHDLVRLAEEGETVDESGNSYPRAIVSELQTLLRHAREQLDVVKALHRTVAGNHCLGCSLQWPCPTAQAWTDAEG